jgi:hypothetical protein
MECKRDLSITNVVEMKYLHFVRDAVYAYAYALRAMHRELCPDGSKVCPEMRREMRNQLTGYIANATFEGRFNFLSLKWTLIGWWIINDWINRIIRWKQKDVSFLQRQRRTATLFGAQLPEDERRQLCLEGDRHVFT